MGLNKINSRSNGGIQCRIGKTFAQKINEIKLAKIKNGTCQNILATEKITNLIARNKNFENIFNAIIQANEEEILRFGN